MEQKIYYKRWFGYSSCAHASYYTADARNNKNNIGNGSKEIPC